MEVSVLESQLQKLPLLPWKKFVKKGKVVPLEFVPKRRFDLADHVLQAFPRTLSIHKNKTLVPGKPLKKPARKRVAVMFSGGPAAGGHNVLVGLKHVLGTSTLLGVRDGPGGFLRGELFEIKNINKLKNTGGFDFLGTDRTKIKSPDQIALAARRCREHKIDAIIIIGGDDSNTNAAVLAEHLPDVQVIGVPKTMDGDLQVNGLLPISFGFDTATKTYAELVGNIARDTLSSKKYWHFIRLMGRDASHVTMEVGFQTQPTLTLLSEEVAAHAKSLHQIVMEIANTIRERANQGKLYGVVLVPEGLLQAIPEFQRMLHEIGVIMHEKKTAFAKRNLKRRCAFLAMKLSKKNRKLFLSLPEPIQEMLSLNRDAHGNVNLSQLRTEELLVSMVEHELKKGAHPVPFSYNTHFFGYEGRCGSPTVFDATLTYNLGLVAGSLVLNGCTGYMAAYVVGKSGQPVAVPLTGLIHLEKRNGELQFVIQKRVVELTDPAYQKFSKQQEKWKHDAFLSPGPIQFAGNHARQQPMIVALNTRDKVNF